MLRVLNLGAGVQSTTLALKAAHGEIGPMPDCAIFADTGWEPPAVYEHLRWMMSGNVLPYPVHVVSVGNLRNDLLTRGAGGRFVTVPWFLRRRVEAGTTVSVYEGGDDGLFDEDEESEARVVGSRTLDRDEVRDGIGRRQCTSHYKIEPIRRKVRELLGYGPRDPIPAGSVEQWIGISTDEVIRATPSRTRYVINRFPFLEKETRTSRGDCLIWLPRNGYAIPSKSSCEGCPFHDNAQWAEIMADPERRADVVEVDAAIRSGVYRNDPRGMLSEQFMHRARVPITEVDFARPDAEAQSDLFLNECQGMCGL